MRPAPARGGPLRITHVVTNEEFAGTERYVVEVSRRQAELGHDVAVIGGRPASMRDLMDPRVRWNPGADASNALRRLLAGGRRDVVHSHVAKSDFVALMAAPVTRAARVSTRHITAPRGFSPLNRRLGTVVRRALDREIAVSRWTSDQLERPTDTVVLNGVRVQPDVDGPRDKVVLLAQRLAPEKDTATALRAWRRSGLHAEGWRMVVAGDGPERAELEQLARDLQVTDSVTFAGWLADVTAAYCTSSLFLAPAPTEPCGLSVLEAMALGLPVIGANAGGLTETIGSFPGAAMFAPRDEDAAAAHLIRLAHDDDARADYGAALRTLQRERFSIERHTDQLEQIYADVVRARHR